MALPDGNMVRYMYPLSMSLVFCGVANAINSRADYLIRFVEKDNISFGLDTSSEDNTMAKWFVLGLNN